jgi:hypothetical protein
MTGPETRREKQRARYYERCLAPGYREAARKRAAQWHARNREKAIAAMRERRGRDLGEREHRLRVRKRYGLSEAGYEEMMNRQNGLCAICGERPQKTRLAVDHDHISGKIRGLVHRKCNVGLGMFDDDIEKLKRAVAYLGGSV